MKTNITYICDYCGKIFNDEDECREHERTELAKQVDNAVMYFDYNGERLSIDATPGIIDYFWVKDETAFEYVNDYFGKCGYACPSVDTPYRKGDFFYDGNNWQNVEELRNHLIEVQEIFKNCGVTNS